MRISRSFAGSVIAMVLSLIVVSALFAEYGYQSVAATTSSKTIPVRTPQLVIINDGSGTIYVRAFQFGDATAAATTADLPIYIDESFTFNDVEAVSILSAGTSTVRLVYR